jgi:polyhydroxybutyrate depolymerase
VKRLLLILCACGSPGSSSMMPDSAESSSPDASTSATCAGKQPQPGDATWTLTVGSLQRTAKVHVPASYSPSTPIALVVNVHGRTHNATGQATLSHAIAKSDAAGFVVIHPEAWGSPTSWNAGACCDPATTNNIDDIGFMMKLLDEAEQKLCIDKQRIYFMGLSNGGYLSHRAGCQLAERVAAIAPVAANLIYQGCAPARPMPVWLAHGTADPLVSYSYIDETVDFWAAKNKCTTTATTYTKGDTACVTRGGCDAGADVVLCTVTDGGHQWPGGDALPFMGKKTDDIIATDAIWEFFVAHPRSL